MILTSGYVNAQDWDELFKAKATEQDPNDQFGRSVAISGKYAIVGAYLEDEDPNETNTITDGGSAFMYERDGQGRWWQVQKLVAWDRDVNDRFGYSVAISGSYAVVGAYLEDEDDGAQNTLNNSGSAYVFELSGGTWNLVQKITTTDRDSNDYFGISVGISGNYIIVGAYGEDEDISGGNTLSEAGSAYIFQRDVNGFWAEIQKVTSLDRGMDDYFGVSVFIDDSVAVIGAYYEDEDVNTSNTLNKSGSAYIFIFTVQQGWIPFQKITASDRGENDLFGWTVGVDNSKIIVGSYHDDEDTAGTNTLSNAGSAYIFEKDSFGVWNNIFKLVASDRGLDDNFGESVAISDNLAIVGAFLEDHDTSGGNFMSASGSAYLFERDIQGKWSERQKLTAIDRGTADRFGYSVTISGNTTIVGAYLEDEDSSLTVTTLDGGSAYFFTGCITQVFNEVAYICTDDSIFLGGAYQTNAGIYYDVYSGSSGCDSAIVTELFISPSFFDLFETNICDGDSVFLAGAWQTTAGIYTDTLQTVNSCDSIVQITLIIDPVYNVTSEDTICQGEKQFLGGAWQDTSGTFIDNLVSVTGCDSLITTNLFVKPVDTAVNQNGTVLSANDPGSSYQWINCDSNTIINGATSQEYNVTTSGTFAVVVTTDGCSDTSGCRTFEIDGIEIRKTGEFIIYPNPADKTLVIKNFSTDVFECRIINLQGQIVLPIVNIGTHKTIIEVGGLVPGMYFVHLINGSNRRIVKMLRSSN